MDQRRNGAGLDWLVTDFTRRVTDVAHAVVTTSDGIAMAASASLPAEHATQLAIITCGLSSLMLGAARVFDGGPPVHALVAMDRGLMLIRPVSDRAILAVLAPPDADLDGIAYEMTLLVEAVGEALTPLARTGGSLDT